MEFDNFTIPTLPPISWNLTDDFLNDDIYNNTDDNFTFPTLPPGYFDEDGKRRYVYDSFQILVHDILTHFLFFISRLEDIPLPDPYVSVYRDDKYNECKPGQTPYPFWCEVIEHKEDTFFDYLFDYYQLVDDSIFQTPDELKQMFDLMNLKLHSANVIQTFNAGGTQQWYCLNHFDVLEESGLLPWAIFITLNGELFDLETTMNDNDMYYESEDYCFSISCDDSCGCTMSPVQITMN